MARAAMAAQETADTEVAGADMEKVRTAAAVIRGAQALIPVTDSANALWREYWDVIGDDGLNEAELKMLGIKADTLTSTLTLLENFTKLVNGEVPAKSEYRVTLNKIRRVAAQV